MSKTSGVVVFLAHFIAMRTPTFLVGETTTSASLTRRTGRESQRARATTVAPLLAYLRELQRRYHVAVLLVHHARKGGAKMRAGQALRGSSEFHAWGDSNLYLRRHGDQLTLSVEHRAAAAISSVALRLDTAEDAVALTATDLEPAARATDPQAAAELNIDQRILAELELADAPLSATALRKRCRIRNATLQVALVALVAAGRLRKDRTGYAVAR